MVDRAGARAASRRLPLFFGAVALTAFNDNAAITYLATLVPGFTESLKYAVVAGAVVGGGLTVIANAPNPAGQATLGEVFPGRRLAARALPRRALSDRRHGRRLPAAPVLKTRRGAGAPGH